MNQFSKQSNAPSEMKILQISDMHLFEDPNQTLVGVKTEETFLAILEKAQSESWPPDVIFFTGDISQDSSAQAYKRLIEHMASYGIPCYSLPGNHDKPEILGDNLNTNGFYTQPFLHTEHWLFAFLDSATPNEEGGTLDELEIINLKAEIEKHPDKNVLVCLHHQLIPVGSVWLDTMTVVNPQSLIALVKNTPKIKGIIHGHVHQQFESVIHNTPIYATPSTCFQFKPLSKDFAVDDIAPGYRWLILNKAGDISTDVVRLDSAPDSLERQSPGY